MYSMNAMHLITQFAHEIKDLMLGHLVWMCLASVLGYLLKSIFGRPEGRLSGLILAEYLLAWLLPQKVRQDVLADLTEQISLWSVRFGPVRARRLCLWWLFLASVGWAFRAAKRHFRLA